MSKAPRLTWLTIVLVIATLLVPMLVAQTQAHQHDKSTAQGKQKVSMRQMGMGKMKNSERWKAAKNRADRHAAALRKHGKEVK